MSRTAAVIWTIARRDYRAAVWSRLFLLFLALPVVFGMVAAVFGAIAARQAAPPRAAIAAEPTIYPMVAATRARLAAGLGSEAVPPVVPAGRAAAPVTIAGSRAAPRIVAAPDAPPGLVDAARLFASDRAGAAGPSVPLVAGGIVRSAGAGGGGAGDGLARGAQYAILILTIILTGRLLSGFVEERSGKIVEVLAAAAPVDAIFLGKLLGMLLYAWTAILAWAAIGVATVLAVAPGILADLPVPAVGWPAFGPLAIAYFTANFLLFGALLLGFGAQARTPADIQTLALPTTLAQFLLFGLASLGVAAPAGRIATAAAILPWSSPLAMVALSVERAGIWPHLAAIGWQAAWVALTVRIAAGLFRRAILQSGPQRR